jgi:hypothetical protein
MQPASVTHYQIGITYFTHCAIVNTSQFAAVVDSFQGVGLKELTRPSPRRPLFSYDGAV